MQVLAIERFTDKKYEVDAKRFLEQNHPLIVELYEEGIVRTYWSRGDKPGTVLMLEVDSAEHAKQLLKALPLVQQKVLTYSVLPLEPYQVQELMPETAQEFVTLIYVSAEKYAMSDEALQDILSKSRTNNAKHGITGMLLYTEGSFLQILEGYEDEVTRLYEKIAEDARHYRVAKVTVIKGKERLFSDWTMGFASVNARELESIEGMNDFFGDGKCLADLNERQVINILDEFESGKWRQQIK